MKKIVVFTGAGVSADSGLATFRDADGLWANYRIEDVCTPEALARNRALVVEFYNKRRKELLSAQPNAAHAAIAALERTFDVEVVTQNVDDLHERAGSSNVLHLHGELRKVRAIDDESLVYTLKPGETTTPDTVIDGHHVRPHIVFFQEAVPNFEPATEIAAQADIFVIIGTTLSVYPAAALLRYVRPGVPVYYIDPNPADVPASVHVIRAGASEGVQRLAEILLADKK